MRAVFVGRFQPFHKGHLYTVRQIIERNEDLVIAIGSAQYSHTPENPFTGGERVAMIKATLIEERLPLSRIDIVPVPDINIHPLWVAHLRSLVPPFEKAYTHNPLVRQLFKDAGVTVDNTSLLEREQYSGDQVRSLMRQNGAWDQLVPPVVARFIRENRLDERVRMVGEVRIRQ